MGYKVIMTDSSPGSHRKRGRSHPKEPEEGVDKCWETGGSAGLATHPGSRTPACFLLPFILSPCRQEPWGSPATLRFQATNQQLAKGLEFRFLCPGN